MGTINETPCKTSLENDCFNEKCRANFFRACCDGLIKKNKEILPLREELARVKSELETEKWQREVREEEERREKIVK